ncbi:hypothetical protein N0B44_26630 [Roseibacterium beibuensis]|uniref:hypothetical protein n=1 Tax=[Roseibacterium] beibuensis TaxID=1193142 RepID=UPI00217E3E28|nr:hypothetical protein [Roseibacterium beibuensis]MCS6626503.1 hypothetical protein [Roseibacterium beibuensis]
MNRRRFVLAVGTSAAPGWLIACDESAPGVPEEQVEPRQLDISAKVPDPRSGEVDYLNRAAVVAALCRPLHALAARDRQFRFELACEGCSADLRVALTVTAQEYSAYQIVYQISAAEGRTGGTFSRDEAYISSVGAKTPYGRPGRFARSVWTDLEAIGSRVVELIGQNVP